MRTKPGLLVASLAGAAALTVGVGGALASGGGGTCTSKLTNSNSGPSGTMSGRIHCSKPAGRGKSHWTYSSTLAPGKGGMSLNLVYKGKFKDKFGKGTIHGSFNMSGAVLPPQGMTFTMTGKFKIAGGTGKLRRAHGSGTISCSSTDFTQHFKCTQILKRGKL